MSDEKGSGCGCLGLVILCLTLWALLFGVTWGGKHYGVGCTRAKGIEFKRSPEATP